MRVDNFLLAIDFLRLYSEIRSNEIRVAALSRQKPRKSKDG